MNVYDLSKRRELPRQPHVTTSQMSRIFGDTAARI